MPSGRTETTTQQVAALVELLDRLGLPRVDVVGASYGGLVAVRLALTHPERVGRLVLVDAVALRPTGKERDAITARFGGRREADALLLPRTVDELRVWLGTLFHRPSCIPTWALAQILRELLRDLPQKTALCRSMVDEVLDSSLLERIKVPSLVVWGRHDPLLVPSLGRRLATALRARVVMLESSGHAPQLEQPDEFNRVVLDFLAADRARGKRVVAARSGQNEPTSSSSVVERVASTAPVVHSRLCDFPNAGRSRYGRSYKVTMGTSSCVSTADGRVVP